MRALRISLGAACAALLASADTGAQSARGWSGTLRIEYAPTRVVGHMMASATFPGGGGIAVTCSSERTDFTPCSNELWGAFMEPPRSARYVVIRIYKDGAVVLSDVVARNEFTALPRSVAVSWDVSASSAGAYWSVLAEGGPITVELLDANGLGQPIPYAEHTLDIPALPQRAVDAVRTMRTSDLRPSQWAREVLGGCAEHLVGTRSIVDVELSGPLFEREECRPW